MCMGIAQFGTVHDALNYIVQPKNYCHKGPLYCMMCLVSVVCFLTTFIQDVNTYEANPQ